MAQKGHCPQSREVPPEEGVSVEDTSEVRH